MLFNTHVRIGSTLHEEIARREGVIVPRQAFLYGHIKPDLERKGEKDRHIFSITQEWTRDLAGRIIGRSMHSERDPKGDAILLGELCHHICDAFCRYHYDTKLYTDFKRHFVYEVGLHTRYLRLNTYGVFQSHRDEARRKKPDSVEVDSRVTLSELDCFLKTRLAAYGEMEPSFDLDIRFALSASQRVVELMCPYLVRSILEDQEPVNLGFSMERGTLAAPDLISWRDAI